MIEDLAIRCTSDFYLLGSVNNLDAFAGDRALEGVAERLLEFV
jgi:hypothetical protein